jgi:hypothetical protein
VTGLYDQEVEEKNARPETKGRFYRDWTEEDLVAEIARTIKMKDKKIAKKKAESPAWPFAYVNLVIPTDELAITREMVNSLQGRFHALEVTHLKETYLLLSYDPGTTDHPCIRVL